MSPLRIASLTLLAFCVAGCDSDGGENANSNANQSVCGNGILEPGENCDDGNDLDGDGCSATCEPEP